MARRRRGWAIPDGLIDGEPWWASTFLFVPLPDGLPDPEPNGEREARRTERVIGRREVIVREFFPTGPSVMGSRGMTGQGPEDGVDRIVFMALSLIFLLVFKSQKLGEVGEEVGGISAVAEWDDVCVRWWLGRPSIPPDDDVAAARLLAPSDNRKRREEEELAWPW